MANEADVEEGKQGGKGNQAWNRESFLESIKNEAVKKEREALKGRIAGLMAKRKEAQKAVAVIDKEIEDEITKFEAGLS